MIKLILVVITAAISAILIFAATKPDSFRIERSLTIKAPPQKVFPLINDFHQWEAWSPWENIDPDIKRHYSGAPAGEGAVYQWDGNKEIGKGRMEIVESQPPSKVLITIDFIEPIEGHNTIEFKLESAGSTTTVTQAMYGPSPYLSKLMGLFFNMETMIGQKQEEGLANIKAMVEKDQAI